MQIYPQAEGTAVHTHTELTHNYKTKIPQDTCRIKPWNDPWYYVFLLNPCSSARNTKQELAPPCWLPCWAWTMEPCQPVSPYPSCFPVSQVPRKHTWAFLAASPQPILHCALSMYLVWPCFKIFIQPDCTFPGASVCSLLPAAPPPLWLSTSAQTDIQESSVSLHKPAQCLSCQLHLRATLLHEWPCTHEAKRDTSRLVQAMPTGLGDGMWLSPLVGIALGAKHWVRHCFRLSTGIYPKVICSTTKPQDIRQLSLGTVDGRHTVTQVTEVLLLLPLYLQLVPCDLEPLPYRQLPHCRSRVLPSKCTAMPPATFHKVQGHLMGCLYS